MSIIIFSETGTTALLQTLVPTGENLHHYEFSSGVTHLAELAPELVIINCSRDTDRGIALLEALKRYHHALPVVFLTDTCSEETIIRAFRSGAREFFRAPVSAGELLQTVSSILDLKRQTHQQRVSLQVSRDGALSVVSGTGDTLPENIRRAVRFIRENLAAPLNLDLIAREAHLSKFHFSRVFKSFVGMSPKQFTLTLRINHAVTLLRNAGMSISTIALRTGFNDLGEFTRQFRKIVGKTPSAFRNSLRT